MIEFDGIRTIKNYKVKRMTNGFFFLGIVIRWNQQDRKNSQKTPKLDSFSLALPGLAHPVASASSGHAYQVSSLTWDYHVRGDRASPLGSQGISWAESPDTPCV